MEFGAFGDSPTSTFYHGTSRVFAEALLTGTSSLHPFRDEASAFLRAAMARVLDAVGSIGGIVKLIDSDQFRDLDVNLYAIQNILAGEARGSWAYGDIYVTNSRARAERYARRMPELLWIAAGFEAFQVRLTGSPMLTVANGFGKIAALLEGSHEPAVAIFELRLSGAHRDRDGAPLTECELREEIENSRYVESMGGEAAVDLRLSPGTRPVAIHFLPAG